MELSQVTIVDTDKVDAIPTIYCNQIRATMSQWDITIEFGQAIFTKMVRNEDGTANLPVEFKTRIMMSPQHAKAVAQILMQTVQKYEQDFGELTIQAKQQK